MSVIRIIDFETTGTEPPAQVCEAGWCDLTLSDGEWAIGKAGSYLCGVSALPPAVRAIHHIGMADVAGRAAFSPEKLWLDAQDAGVSAVAAHNSGFEEKFWGDCPVPVICTYKVALALTDEKRWPVLDSYSNGAIRYWLEDRGEIAPVHDLTMPPHRAGPDAYVTAWLLKAMLRVASGKEMVAWTKEPARHPTCPIGKEWRGKAWAEVDTGFLLWMTRQADMEADLKWNASRELSRRQASA
jgi:exodeoxyribonuclease X